MKSPAGYAEKGKVLRNKMREKTCAFSGKTV